MCFDKADTFDSLKAVAEMPKMILKFALGWGKWRYL